MQFKDNWSETKQRFNNWWKNGDSDRPIVRIVTHKKSSLLSFVEPHKPKNLRDYYLSAEYRFESMQHYCAENDFLGEAFPYIDLNMGPGSMAAYLGCEPIFNHDTVWYKEIVKESIEELGQLKFNSDSRWWKEHFSEIKKVSEICKDTGIYATIPDILENIDILSLMRSPQELCFDLIDYPDIIDKYIKQVDDLYFKYYDACYNVVKKDDGTSSYTAFSILGEGRVAKIQCDFSALMSPTQFNDLIIPSLTKQSERLDNILYHLDGPDAIRHVDALMKLDRINALQWTAGAGQPDGGDLKWYPLYDKVKSADKAIWINIYDGDVDVIIDKSKRLVMRYGSKGMYFLYPDMDRQSALKLFSAAEKGFK